MIYNVWVYVEILPNLLGIVEVRTHASQQCYPSFIPGLSTSGIFCGLQVAGQKINVILYTLDYEVQCRVSSWTWGTKIFGDFSFVPVIHFSEINKPYLIIFNLGVDTDQNNNYY